MPGTFSCKEKRLGQSPILHIAHRHGDTQFCAITSEAQCCSVPQVRHYRIAGLGLVCVHIVCSCSTPSEDISPETSCQPLAFKR